MLFGKVWRVEAVVWHPDAKRPESESVLLALRENGELLEKDTADSNARWQKIGCVQKADVEAEFAIPFADGKWESGLNADVLCEGNEAAFSICAHGEEYLILEKRDGNAYLAGRKGNKWLGVLRLAETKDLPEAAVPSGENGDAEMLVFQELMGKLPADAACIGIIGGTDGPTSIYIAGNKENKN